MHFKIVPHTLKHTQKPCIDTHIWSPKVLPQKNCIDKLYCQPVVGPTALWCDRLWCVDPRCQVPSWRCIMHRDVYLSVGGKLVNCFSVEKSHFRSHGLIFVSRLIFIFFGYPAEIICLWLIAVQLTFFTLVYYTGFGTLDSLEWWRNKDVVLSDVNR